MKSTAGAEIEPEGNFHDGLDDSVNAACLIEKLELNLEYQRVNYEMTASNIFDIDRYF